MLQRNTDPCEKSTPNVVGVVLDGDTGACYPLAMSDLGNEVRERRRAMGLSQADLAAQVGTAQQTIDKIERGIVKFSRYLPKIREALGINFESAGSQFIVPSGATPTSLVGERDLPVFASVEGGDGGLVVSSEAVDYVRRPAPLAQVKDGYAILVVGESMVPAFEPGDLVLVHPHLPPIRECDVVLYGQDGAGNDVVTIKRLMRFTATDWHLRQHNPPEGRRADFALPRKVWNRCHRIVGKFSRR